ncbi:hypothetical protein [Geotalea sp. SG265]|uniref:hypothetical protein n=1 Tax=Geotalea sp. SG265 TaxID=2922867 RepID=UPI001FAF0CE5|nr:hypothetical protein [Geotalea sp. SG265]
MRLSVKMIVLLGLLLACAAGAAAAGNLPFEEQEPEGFRDITWGTPVSQVEGLKFSADGTAALRELYKRTRKQAAAQVSVYSRPGDRLKIGEGTLTRIYYYFYDDLFYGATAYFTGRDNYEKLLSACYKKFGEPTLTEADRVEWQGKSTSIVLSQKGVFSMDSEKIKDQMEEPEGF